MPVEVILDKKISDSVWSAIGSFSGKDEKQNPVSGPAEILLKETGKGELVPFLDSSKMNSKIMNRTVTSYVNAAPVKAKAKEGAVVKFEKLWFHLAK